MIPPVAAVGVLGIIRLPLLLSADAHHFLECKLVIKKIKFLYPALVRSILKNKVFWMVCDSVVDVVELELALLLHLVDGVD